MGFIARQPNGLLCRYSSVSDCITDYNMTEEDYIKICMERAREEAKEILNGYIRDFELVRCSLSPNNMNREKFEEIIKEMERPAEECKHVES